MPQQKRDTLFNSKTLHFTRNEKLTWRNHLWWCSGKRGVSFRRRGWYRGVGFRGRGGNRGVCCGWTGIRKGIRCEHGGGSRNSNIRSPRVGSLRYCYPELYVIVSENCQLLWISNSRKNLIAFMPNRTCLFMHKFCHQIYIFIIKSGPFFQKTYRIDR